MQYYYKLLASQVSSGLKVCHRRLTQFPQSNVRVRFAPSPTGQLHLGGLRTALYNYLFARSQKGKFILRIEDTDQSRIVSGAVESLTSMLQWAGIEIDEGPFNENKEYGPYTQSLRRDIYQKYIKILLQNGSAYRCYCTTKRLDLLRKDAARRRETFRYDNHCRYLDDQELSEKIDKKTPYVVRLKMEDDDSPWNDLVYGETQYNVGAIEGDPILMKSDEYPTYHFANVVDDHLMKITHVLRGVEWQISTPKHLKLYKAFGWRPPKYAHLPVLLNKDGTKLSKRQDAIHIENLKLAGYSPEAVIDFLTSMGGGFTVNDTNRFSMHQLIEHFDLSTMLTRSTHVDMSKLLYINQYYHVKRIADPAHLEAATDFLYSEVEKKYITNETDRNILQDAVLNKDYIRKVLLWSQNRISLCNELLLPKFSYLWSTPTKQSIADLKSNDTLVIIQSAIQKLNKLCSDDYDMDSIKTTLQRVIQNGEVTLPTGMKILRLAISGQKQGPPVAEMISMMGKTQTITRLTNTQNQLIPES